ncbi:MAG: hypothetical protein KDD61_14205 [Bdellovibrionales bacterium]|nr:hypothetical protein [Bdellovibrionales bacterium]
MKFIYLSFCFLMFSFPIAAKPLLERISGTWENNKKFECLSGQKPTDISDVRLKLTPLPGKTKNDGFRVLADKAVLSLNCTVKKPNPKAPLFSSSYEFEVRPLSPEVIGDEIAWRIQNETQSNFQASSKVPFIVEQMLAYNWLKNGRYYILKGIEEREIIINDDGLFLCNPLKYLILSNLIFPEYFKKELTREYFVQQDEDEIQIFFVEEMFCPKDVTVLTLKKVHD